MKYNQYSSIEKTSAFSKKNWSLIQLLLDIFTKTKKDQGISYHWSLNPERGISQAYESELLIFVQVPDDRFQSINTISREGKHSISLSEA